MGVTINPGVIQQTDVAAVAAISACRGLRLHSPLWLELGTQRRYTNEKRRLKKSKKISDNAKKQQILPSDQLSSQ
jgi:hypothetical protein